MNLLSPCSRTKHARQGLNLQPPDSNSGNVNPQQQNSKALVENPKTDLACFLTLLAEKDPDSALVIGHRLGDRVSVTNDCEQSHQVPVAPKAGKSVYFARAIQSLNLSQLLQPAAWVT
jgi:hypothetical protein